MFLCVVHPADFFVLTLVLPQYTQRDVNYNKIRSGCEMRDVLTLNEGIKKLFALFFSKGCNSYMEKAIGGLSWDHCENKDVANVNREVSKHSMTARLLVEISGMLSKKTFVPYDYIFIHLKN